MTDMDRRGAAIARLKTKREFLSHLSAYVVVNGFLVVIWAMTTNGGYFWPIWPMAGWGIGLLLHGWETFRPPISEQAIQRQMEKM